MLGGTHNSSPLPEACVPGLRRLELRIAVLSEQTPGQQRDTISLREESQIVLLKSRDENEENIILLALIRFFHSPTFL